MDTNGMCQLSHTLERLIMWFEFGEISILDYKLYIDDSQTPVILTTENDYQPYLAYYPLYIIEDSTFDNIRYTKSIRLTSPKERTAGKPLDDCVRESNLRYISGSPSHDLATLIMKMECFDVSILDYKLYIDESTTPITLNSKADYEPYLDYRPFYVIEDATFDNIRYTKAIRLISPKNK